MKKMNKLKVFIMGLLAIVAIGTTVWATSTPVPPGGVEIESNLGVLNNTKGEVTYESQTNATFDDVVNIDVTVHNHELVDSGKNAQGVNLRVAMPSTKGTAHTITSVVGGTNTNTVTQTANVSTNEVSTLTYIPGTAIHTYNAGTNENKNWVTEHIDDSIVGSGYNTGTVRPCCNFQESIIFQARVMVPTISITKEVKIDGAGTWQDSIQAQPGDKLNYLITVKNEGNTNLNNIVVRDSMPPDIKFIPGSATLINANYPNGTPIDDQIVQAGVNIGSFAPGGGAYVRLQANVPADDSACNLTHTNVAHATESTVGDYLNNATVVVKCQNIKDARIKIIKFNDANGNKVQDAGESYLSGWQFKVTGPSYDQTFTTDESGQVMITSLAAGKYTVTEITKDGWTNTTGLTVSQDITLGQTAEFKFGNKQNVTPPPPPPTPVTPGEVITLPSSGPAEMAGMFLGSMSISGGALAYMRSKKRLKDAYRK